MSYSDFPGWNGFMEQITVYETYDSSKVICLPFINSPPSNYHTIFTSLLVAANKCKAQHQKMCFVTFDQPLYLKARDILANDHPKLSDVTVRLGGFHLLMSFMGSIGIIMAGSGLKELLTTIFAENSVDKILTGHAYSRAVRVHILIHYVLATLVFDEMKLTEDTIASMKALIFSKDLNKMLAAPENDNDFQIVLKQFRAVLDSFSSNGPTAKLWIQYFRMTTLMKQFIEAERSVNSMLHLETVKKMLPFFHAAGHFLYAKCGHLYLQDMMKLHEIMDPTEYEEFSTRGYFTIRRSDKYWCGIWSDMTIEQTLMKSMKSSGGLTHGRGITDSVLTRWTLGMVHMQNICDEVEAFCNVQTETSKQHVDMRTSRIDRDKDDTKKLHDWLIQHPPFAKTDCL